MNCTAAITTDFEDMFHLSHAVVAGPYTEIDFNEEGRALVSLDGTGSHSHATDPSPGRIVEYTWTWMDPGNTTDNNGLVTVHGERPQSLFPLGVTNMSLEVTDQYCNRAVEGTTVTVESTIQECAYCYIYDFGDSMPTEVPLPQSISALPKPGLAHSPGAINYPDDESQEDASPALRRKHTKFVEENGKGGIATSPSFVGISDLLSDQDIP